MNATEAAAMERVRAPKAAELVAAQLRRRIVAGHLEPGAVLPAETALVAQFGVSRPTLREAFRILEAERLIVVQRGSRGGARVLPPDGDVAARQVGLLLQYRGVRVRDVYEAAARVESSVVAGLAATRTDDDLRELEGCLARLSATPVQDPAYAVLDREFHGLLGRLCPSRTLDLCLQLMDGVLTAASAARLRRDPVGEVPAKAFSLRRYARLIELVRAGDAEGASAHWHRHMLAVGRYLAGDEDPVVELLS